MCSVLAFCDSRQITVYVYTATSTSRSWWWGRRRRRRIRRRRRWHHNWPRRRRRRWWRLRRITRADRRLWRYILISIVEHLRGWRWSWWLRRRRRWSWWWIFQLTLIICRRTAIICRSRGRRRGRRVTNWGWWLRCATTSLRTNHRI